MAGRAGRTVAQYLRMSTEMQTYSLEFQAAANAAFAAAQGWRVVNTYTDPGISGLSLNSRPGLRSLLADVLAGEACYDAVLVYDVSRWGRFQDLDLVVAEFEQAVSRLYFGGVMCIGDNFSALEHTVERLDHLAEPFIINL